MLGAQDTPVTDVTSTKKVEETSAANDAGTMSASEPSKTPDEPAIDATEPDEEPEQPRRDKGKRKLADDEVEAELAAERKRRQVEEGSNEQAESDGLPEDEESAAETSEGSEGDSEDDSESDDEENDEGEEENMAAKGKRGGSSAMAEDFVEELEDAQELQDLFEDLDEIDSAAIFTVGGRRTRGKQIDFVAAMERDRSERRSGAGGSSVDAEPPIQATEEDSDDGFDEDYVGQVDE